MRLHRSLSLREFLWSLCSFLSAQFRTSHQETKGLLDLEEELARLREEHTPEAIALRLGDGPSPSYLRDFIYGAIDGAGMVAESLNL